jgi:hypothetical protein
MRILFAFKKLKRVSYSLRWGRRGGGGGGGGEMGERVRRCKG